MIFSFILGLLACNVEYPTSIPDSEIARDGDIIFQVSRSSQSVAIAAATNSSITHVGVIAVDGTKVNVIEAIEPVRETPIDQFIDRGGPWGVYRLKSPPDDPNWAERIVSAARSMKGKHYDGHFQWSDDRIYCSELVWKSYVSGTGVELVAPQRLGDLNLSLPPVQSLIKRRMGSQELNLDEVIVTPAALHESDKLEMVMGFI